MNGELAQVLDLDAYRRRRAAGDAYPAGPGADALNDAWSLYWRSLYSSIWLPTTWAEPRTQEALGFKWADHLWKKEIK